MKITPTQTLQSSMGAAAVAAACLLGSATAYGSATDTWDFRSGGSGSGNAARIYSGSTTDPNGVGMDVAVTGWYAYPQNGDHSIVQANQWIGHYHDGLGLFGDDHHAIDNKGDQEFLIFQFDDAVSLRDVSFGWIKDDADITVMYKSDETDGNTGDLAGKKISTGLTHSGYDLLGNFSYHSGSFYGGGSAVRTTNVSSDPGIYSKVWLVGAFFGNYLPNNKDHWTTGNDKFKIAGISASRRHYDTPGGNVPVPATLFLLAIGLLPLARKDKGLSVAR